MGHYLYKHYWYNNHSGAYIADTQNSTGAYIVIMASLQELVNNLFVILKLVCISVELD